MSEPQATPVDYTSYFKVWGVLLVVTLLMVVIQVRAFLVLGMCLKGWLIAWYFMHLRHERRDFVFYVVGSIAIFALVLFGLIAPDGLVM